MLTDRDITSLDKVLKSQMPKTSLRASGLNRSDRSDWEQRKKEKWRKALEKENRDATIRQMKYAAERNGLSVLLKECKFANFRTDYEWQQKAKAVAEDYAVKPSGWFLICGTSGTGKTHLCTAITRQLIKQNIPVSYMLWRQDSPQLKQSSMNDELERLKLMRLYKNAKALYVDDFMKGGHSEADIKVAFELLDHRYRTRKITLISTELSPSELINMDNATGSRIVGLSKNHTVWISGSLNMNYRLSGGEML